MTIVRKRTALPIALALATTAFLGRAHSAFAQHHHGGGGGGGDAAATGGGDGGGGGMSWMLGTTITSSNLAVLPPSFLVGVKLSRFYIGGQLGYTRFGVDTSMNGVTVNSHQSTALLEAIIQVPLLNAGNLEGYLQGGLGVGHTWGPVQGGTGQPPFLLGGSMLYTIEAAFGTRYFFDPSFALGVLVGLRLDDTEGSVPIGGGMNVDVSQTGIGTFAGLTATALF
jgi:hypothetical protein